MAKHPRATPAAARRLGLWEEESWGRNNEVPTLAAHFIQQLVRSILYQHRVEGRL